jgi:hypothetical protein
LKPILVNLLLAVQTHNVVKITDKQFVLAYLDTLELLQLVDRNVSQALNALRMKLAIIRSVLILVQEHAASMQTAKFEIIIQFAAVLQDIQAIRS